MARPDGPGLLSEASDPPRVNRPRFSMRGRLTLSVVAAVLPLIALTAWLARGSWHEVVLVTISLLFSLILGLAVSSWAYRPVSDLATKARGLAGVPDDRRRLRGLFRTATPGDQAIAAALERIEISLQQIRALNRVAQLVASDSDLKNILTAIAEEAVALLHGDAGVIGLWDAQKEVFRDVAACNLPIFFPEREFEAHESLASQVAKTGRVVFVDDYMQYPYRLRDVDRFMFRGAVGAPLLVGGKVRGALTVMSVDPSRRFTPRDGEILATFANQAGAAFEKARLYQLALDQLEALRRARAALAQESRQLERALAHMVRVQEDERTRIAADIHDGVVQTMVGSLCELQAAMAHASIDPESARAKQERARVLIRDSITELRRVIFDLRPITLDTAGLVPAARDLQAGFPPGAGAKLQLSVVGTACRLRPEVEIGAYRIIQEAVNNAAKHAEASSIEVTIEFSPHSLALTIQDDGKGFSAEETLSPSQVTAGLIGMRERARSLGGKLSITSAPGQGTVVKAVVPGVPNSRSDTSRHLDVDGCPDDSAGWTPASEGVTPA